MLQLYTEDYARDIKLDPKHVTRWHDDTNSTVREFALRAEHGYVPDGRVTCGLLPNNCTYATLQRDPGSGAVATMVKAMEGLNFVTGMHRSKQHYSFWDRLCTCFSVHRRCRPINRLFWIAVPVFRSTGKKRGPVGAVGASSSLGL